MKRGLPASVGEEESDLKKIRRSERVRSQNNDHLYTPVRAGGGLPSPLTHQDSTTTEAYDHSKDGTVTPPSQVDVVPSSQYISPKRSTGFNQYNRMSQYSPPLQDTQTQPFSQFLPPLALDYEVEDEEEEGVWGYMVPTDKNSGEPLVLKSRSACPMPDMPSKKEKKRVAKDEYENQEQMFEATKITGFSSSGYLIGRHPECDRIVGSPTVSNRHCLLFPENTKGTTTAVLEDLSGNGTYVNDQLVGRNKRRELQDGDEISILDEARYCFRYPRNRDTNGFRQRYSMQQQLGKGHFASVYLCVEKNTGMRYAVKKFEKRAGPGERSKVEGLQQEIAVLMGVSHPSLLCLKDTFDEEDGVYLVLDLAPEGELFNYIVMKQKLSETETRKVFVQLFQAVKYLHERSIVHRDIKPENILLYDKDLTVKLADFGLAKIIGEESFTTTLCGTPSYVAPEILQSSNHRRYTRAVDVWSLGVVLYICLCGFPPFSDELYDPVNNPYTLAQQILGGRFDYPSPYWDSVGDPALDLIDRMLTVDPDKRISIDACLEHPWTTGREIPPTQLMNSMDSTDGLVGQLTQLDFSRRKPVRERTLLSEINDITVTRVIEAQDDTQGNSQAPVKIFEKNKGGHNGPSMMPASGRDATAGATPQKKGVKVVRKEETPAGHRGADDFMALGGKGDQVLFAEDEASNYPSQDKNGAKEVVANGKSTAAQGGKKTKKAVRK